MFLLANLYYFGKGGVAQDYNKGREWYENAANAGLVWAMLSIADLFEDGKGVPQDNRKAHEWYEKAAGTGNANAMNRLASHYERALASCNALGSRVRSPRQAL
jgi:TPR repeat protein